MPPDKKIAGIYKKLLKFFGPQHWWPADTRLEVIVGAILTQNTSWSNVEKAIDNLKRAKALSSPRRLSGMDKRTLSRLIKPAGFYNLKTGRITDFLSFLSTGYDLDLNKLARLHTGELRQRLLDVNGIGPETCDSILLYAFKRPVFVVDAYTRRVFSRHRLVAEDDDYKDIQALFMRNLPREGALFNEYHALIVRLAKDFCRKRPKCGACPLKKYLACK